MWNRYTFYTTHIVQSSDPASDLYALQTLDVTCSTSGGDYLIFGDSEGGITLCNQIYSLKRFIAADHCVNFMYMSHNSDLLYTVCDCKDSRPDCISAESRRIANQFRADLKKNDRFSWILEELLLNNVVEPESAEVEKHAVLKIWNLHSLDESGSPICLRTFNLFQQMEEETITTFTVSEEEEIVLFGSEKGRVFYIQGDILRTNFTMLNLFPPIFSDSITALHLTYEENDENSIVVFITSNTQIGCYIFPRNSRSLTDSLILLEKGCDRNCSCLDFNHHLVCGDSDGFHIINSSGIQMTFPITGQKKYIASFKNCIIVGSFDENGQQMITIYNIKDKFIEFGCTLYRNSKTEYIQSITNLWDSIFIITRSRTVFLLQEKDLQTKLRSLYERNQYDIAISIAQQCGMDVNGLLDIHRLYGDFLYDEDENDKAIEEYKKTIGFIEPSYIIRKFLDAQHMPQLAIYLEALHEQGLANSEHTTLLINCYTKLKEKEKLHQFIYSDQAGIHFDISMAVEVLCKASWYEEALHLSKKHKLFTTYLKIQIEERQDYRDALEFIISLPAELAATALQLYGKKLLAHYSVETTDVLIQLCIPRSSSFVPHPTETSLSLSSIQFISDDDDEEAILNGSCVPENYIQCFVDQPIRLKQFLSAMLKYRNNNDAIIWNTILELYLRKDLVEEEFLIEKGDDYNQEEVNQYYSNEVMKILTNPDACYDPDQAFVLIQMHNFKEGLIYLYTKYHMYNLLIKFYLSTNNTEKAIDTCKLYGNEDSSLWIQLLTMYSEIETINLEQLNEVIMYLYDNKIVTPLMIVHILSKNKNITYGMLKDMIIKCVTEKTEFIKEDRSKIHELKNEITEMETEMNDIKEYPL